MATQELFSQLGAEFNDELNRSDGPFLAQQLSKRLDEDHRSWFDERVFREFECFPRIECPEHDYVMTMLRGVGTVHFFQAVEAAEFARVSSYIPRAKGDWFVYWCLRLRVGADAEDARRVWLPIFWGEDEPTFRRSSW